MSKSIVAGALLFVVVLGLGLHTAEMGVDSMLGIQKPPLVEMAFEEHGEFDVTLLGLHRHIDGRIMLGEFYASPDRLIIGWGAKRVELPMRFLVPGSDRALSMVRTAVVMTIEAAVSASRTIWRWWESWDEQGRR
jgi:hypothetical protein